MTTKELDASDIDNYLGKPMQQGKIREPIGGMDIRRWAQAMHYPNRLHYDADYAEASRHGKLIAPLSFPVACDDGHGCAPACVGGIPNSHLIFGGDEWWFTDKRIGIGDIITNERIPYDYTVKDTAFAGPTCFQRGDNFFYNQYGDLISKQRSTSIRYNPDNARIENADNSADDPEWTDAELIKLEDDKYAWIKMLHELGHGKRYWDDINVGDKLPTRVIGPHSIASFTTEWRAYLFTIWHGVHRRTDLDMEALGFTDAMAGKEQDPILELDNPELTDGAYIGPSRGHLFPRWARFIGMPRGYGYGASMGSWILDYLSGWAGEWGQLLHVNAAYRGPALTGDVSIMDAEVTDKGVDDEGRNFVGVKFVMKTQLGATMCTATGEIELPTRGE